jgi:hypothetical protein
VYHGKRSTESPPPPNPWSWTRQDLENRIPNYPVNSFNPDHYTGRPIDTASGELLVSLGVFGTSADDVYAWYGNAIYRATKDEAGDPTWDVAYVADDLDRPDEQLFFLSAAGTGPDSVWFSGGRGGGVYDSKVCAIVVRKTTAGFRRVVDGVGAPYPTFCGPRDGTILLEGALGWLTQIRTDSPNSIIGLKGALDIAHVSVAGDTYSAVMSTPPTLTSTASKQILFLSLSAGPNEPLWLGGYSMVVQGKGDLWNDGGAYAISTLSLNGSFINMPVYQIRSTSDSDIWAVGERYALHKTTP